MITIFHYRRSHDASIENEACGKYNQALQAKTHDITSKLPNLYKMSHPRRFQGKFWL